MTTKTKIRRKSSWINVRGFRGIRFPMGYINIKGVVQYGISVKESSMNIVL